MTRRQTCFAGVVLPLALLLGFKIGRDDVSLRPGVVRTPHGLAFKLAYSETDADTGQLHWSRVIWQPGLLRPHVLVATDSADCVPGPDYD